MGIGESQVLTYTLKATDDSGVGTPATPPDENDSDTQTVVVTIDGTNDQPDITVAAGDSAAETLTETDTTLSVSDTLSVEDLDITDIVNGSVVSVVESGDGTGVVTNGTLLAMMTLGANPVIDGTSTNGTISWVFNSGSEAFDHLGVGESLVLTYTTKATDDRFTSIGDVGHMLPKVRSADKTDTSSWIFDGS